jgi:hypothetical protein
MSSSGGIIVGLDPSSTIIGYAAMRRSRTLIDVGVITPAKGSDGSWERIMQMCRCDLLRLLDSLMPAVILVEWTKGKVNERRHGGLGAGLAVYGCGVGAAAMAAVIWAADHGDCEVLPILENDWTRGQRKRDRQLAIASAYPQYAGHLAEDVGGDMSDAIGLCDWWITEQMAAKSLF